MKYLKRDDYKKIKSIVSELNENTRFKMTKNFIQHGNTSVYAHTISVACACINFVRKYKLKVDEKSLIRGALLHDYFLYDWHDKKPQRRIHGFTHPYIACKNALEDTLLNEKEKNIIKRHMFPLTPIPPKYKEAWIVCFIDKLLSLKETFRHRK